MVGKDSESEVADHLYQLILELHAIDSSVLLAVMPQLEFKLKVVLHDSCQDRVTHCTLRLPSEIHSFVHHPFFPLEY